MHSLTVTLELRAARTSMEGTPDRKENAQRSGDKSFRLRNCFLPATHNHSCQLHSNACTPVPTFPMSRAPHLSAHIGPTLLRSACGHRVCTVLWSTSLYTTHQLRSACESAAKHRKIRHRKSFGKYLAVDKFLVNTKGLDNTSHRCARPHPLPSPAAGYESARKHNFSNKECANRDLHRK